MRNLLMVLADRRSCCRCSWADAGRPGADIRGCVGEAKQIGQPEQQFRHTGRYVHGDQRHATRIDTRRLRGARDGAVEGAGMDRVRAFRHCGEGTSAAEASQGSRGVETVARRAVWREGSQRDPGGTHLRAYGCSDRRKIRHGSSTIDRGSLRSIDRGGDGTFAQGAAAASAGTRTEDPVRHAVSTRASSRAPLSLWALS